MISLIDQPMIHANSNGCDSMTFTSSSQKYFFNATYAIQYLHSHRCYYDLCPYF